MLTRNLTAAALIVFGVSGYVASALLPARPSADRYALTMTVGSAAPTTPLGKRALACRSVYHVSTVTVGHRCRRAATTASADLQ